ncbi:endonuclease/exonuclease/phosphatase family protein [Thalassotalea fusca]
MNKIKLAVATALFMTQVNASEVNTIRVATFNVSMEALNYVERKKGEQPKVTGNELSHALANQHQQIKNIAEIIQRVNPDILLLNEFDNVDKNALQNFVKNFLAVPQANQKAISYPYSFQAPVNTGVLLTADATGDNSITHPADTHGFGYFPGHFGMALLSKHPINKDAVRTFQKFLWKDMPNALVPVDPDTNKPWYSDTVWKQLRLSSKSHWDLPIVVNGRTIHVLASHPTPPVFDGPEDRNGKRNHDEIRFWHDYISDQSSGYIYDDNNKRGGLPTNSTFVILGDQNASANEGDAINSGIASLTNHPLVIDPMPTSEGGKKSKADNPNAKYHTAYWGMRADYVLPSKHGWTVTGTGVFWPNEDSNEFRLIKDRQASSDHRLVWVDLQISK